MLSIDIIGLIFTVALIGVRYPVHALAAALCHDLGRILMILFLHGRIEAVIAAGAFGTAAASDIPGGVQTLLVVFSGPLANYILSAGAGGVELEKPGRLLQSAAALKHPFAVVNLRLALLSVVVNLWKYLVQG